MFLPIDAKFPQEDYVRLQQAYEQGHLAEVETAQKALNISVKKFPKTSNKNILILQHIDFELCFWRAHAEVVRQPDLIAQLQREYKIIITGPTTLAAMLNSLQMGLKPLQFKKEAAEVWEVLAALKKSLPPLEES